MMFKILAYRSQIAQRRQKAHHAETTHSAPESAEKLRDLAKRYYAVEVWLEGGSAPVAHSVNGKVYGL